MGKVINIFNNMSTYIVQQAQCSQTKGKYDHIQKIILNHTQKQCELQDPGLTEQFYQ